MGPRVPAVQRRFQLILIKPSHYDDDGYVIRWWRAMSPSNSLAAVYGIAADCAERRVLGPDVAIDIEVMDETNTRIDVPALVARFRRHDNFGMVGLVGVQSNQYPRALDIARPFRERRDRGRHRRLPCVGMPVDAGRARGRSRRMPGHGRRHVRGRGRRAARIAIARRSRGRTRAGLRFHEGPAGYAGHAGAVPSEAACGTHARPEREFRRRPRLSRISARSAPSSTCRAASRATARRTISSISCACNWAQGIHKFFITDDNFARNKEWEAIFDRLIELREQHGIPLGLMIQVDTLCHKIPNFIEKAKRAGVGKVFIGLENINPDNLMAAKKHQNKITEYRKMLLAWRAQGIVTFAGYILGFPADTPQSIRRDIEIIKNELPIDLLEFFVLTPLPGSEDHQALWRKGIDMESDLNKYASESACTDHPRTSRKELRRHLPRGLDALLHAGPHEDAAAARCCDRPADGQPREVHADLRDHRQPRRHASAPGRARAPQASIRAPARPSARERLGVLAALCVEDDHQAREPRRHDRKAARVEDGDRPRSAGPQLHGPGADAGQRRRPVARPSQQDRRRARRGCTLQEGRRVDQRQSGRLTNRSL